MAKAVSWNLRKGENAKRKKGSTTSVHYAAIPLQKWKLRIQARSPPQHPFSYIIIISDKIFGWIFWFTFTFKIYLNTIVYKGSLISYIQGLIAIINHHYNYNLRTIRLQKVWGTSWMPNKKPQFKYVTARSVLGRILANICIF